MRKNNTVLEWGLCVLLVIAIFAVSQHNNYQNKMILQQQVQIMQQQSQIQQLTESCNNWYKLVEEIKNDSVK